MYTLIATAKLNNIDPQAWLDDCAASPTTARRLHELLPWNWHAPTAKHAAA
jgi:transposase